MSFNLRVQGRSEMLKLLLTMIKFCNEQSDQKDMLLIYYFKMKIASQLRTVLNDFQ